MSREIRAAFDRTFDLWHVAGRVVRVRICRKSLLNQSIAYISGIAMAIEWIAETDALTCNKCGETISPGETVLGDFDQFFHKEGCESSD